MSNYQNIIDVIKDREDKGKNGGVRNAISRIESSGMSYDNQFNHFEDRQIAAPVFNSKYVTQYDDPTDPELYDKVAHRQPWINKASAGVARVATKAGSEIAKIPGIAAGILSGTVGQIGDVISGRDDTDFMKVAFDNAWVNALNDANEWVNEEVLPVYVKKSVSEGNLWDNVSSIDFWATDGADGLGYIAAMLAPGAVLSRLKLGKLLVGDIGKLTNMAEKGVSRAGRLAKMGLPTNAKNIDLYLETIANTVLESGLEAQQAMQEFEEGLNEQLKNGLITQEQFDQEIQKRSKIGRNIFGANAAILIGPNAVMSKMLWGGARNSARGIDKTTGRIAKEEAKSVLGRINEAGQTFAKGALREGFWEEGMQETAGNYFGDNPDASFGDYLKGLPASYLDMIGTVDGQKAIFLGAAFGGGMNVFMGSKQSKKERNKKNELIDYTNDRLENLWTSFGEKAYERDENGEPLRDENGRIQFNIPVLQEKLTSMNAMDNLSASYDIAVANGQVEKVAQIRDKAVVAMIMPFLQNEALGVEVLREYLSTAPGLEQLAKDEKVSKESLIESIMDKAKFMQQAMENFNDFSEPLLDINHKEATAEDIDAYYEGLRDVYNNLQANRQFVNKRLEKFTGVLEKVVQERGHNLIKFTDDIDYKNSIKESDMRIKDLSEKVDSYRKADKEISDLENDFWNREKNQKNFDRLFDKLQEVEQAESEEVDSNEIGDTLDSIDKATSNIGVDNIINKYKVGKNKGDLNPMVLEKANEKKEQLKIIEEEAKKKKLEEQKRRSEKSKKSNKEKEEKKDDLGNRIGNNYNPGESIPLTRAELEPYSKEVKKKDKAINEFTGVIAKEI